MPTSQPEQRRYLERVDSQELVEQQGGCDLIPAWAWEQHDEAPPLKICSRSQRPDRHDAVPGALVERILTRPE